MANIDPASLPPIANNPDVRFLGAKLGDVIRAYGGEALFEATEAIRRASVERHRGTGDGDAVHRHLQDLGLDETLDFVRGFMLFSMLANLAEDRQGIAAEQGADVAAALATLQAEGIDRAEVQRLLAHALIVPVLTAHPTEVRRKSMIDHKNRIAELMALKDAGRSETPDGDLVDDAITRQIALLWQTRVLRRERLYVTDEVETALSYMRRVPARPARAVPALGPRVRGARAELREAGQLDRRRPRRQSLRHRRFAAHRAVPRGGGRARLLPRRGACAGG